MRRILLFTMLFFITTVARAQTPCTANDTVDDCYLATYNERLAELRPKSVSKSAAGQAVQRQVQARPTGPIAPGSALGSASSDFLSRLIASLQSAQLDQKNRQLNFAYNFPKDILSSTLRAQVVFHQPEVLKKVQDTLTASGKAEELSGLQGELNDADDISVTLSAAPETKRLGRSFRPHREDFESLYQQTVEKRIKDDRDAALTDEKNKILQRFSGNPGSNQAVDLGKVKIGEVKNDPDFVDKLQAAARSKADLELERARLFEENHLSSFADLLANQPQLSFSVSTRRRDHAVGANELSVSATYEMGFVNLNQACPSSTCDPNKFKTYVEEHLRSLGDTSDAQGSPDNRLSFTLDYRRAQSFAFSLPAAGVDLRIPSTTHWTYGATYGRQLVFDAQGKGIGRIDITGKYENFSDDPLHQDRGTLDLTYTQKVSDTFSLPLGISYANHGEFLGQVDRRLSAHFGLHAKVFGKNE